MKTVILDVRKPEDAIAEFAEVWKSGKPGKTSRRVYRDVKGVHGDVKALLDAGLLIKTEKGAIEFPYDAIKVEFLLEAA